MVGRHAQRMRVVVVCDGVLGIFVGALVVAVCQQLQYHLAATRGQLRVQRAVDLFGRGQTGRILGRQRKLQAAAEQRGAALGAPPGQPRPRVAVQQHAFFQRLLDRFARDRLGRRHHVAGGAVGGHETAEPVAQTVGVVHAQRIERSDHAVHRGDVDFVGVGRHLEVFVVIAHGLVGIGNQGVQVIADQLGRGRCAGADGEGQTGVFGHTVVRDQRRQVEHVARAQHPIVGGLELA